MRIAANMANKKRKNITLDNLAQIMTQSFVDAKKSVNKELEDHRKRIGRLEEQVGKLQVSLR